MGGGLDSDATGTFIWSMGSVHKDRERKKPRVEKASAGGKKAARKAIAFADEVSRMSCRDEMQFCRE